MTTTSDQVDLAREVVVTSSHELAASNLVLGTAGNVSTRVGDLIAVTATGAVLADMTFDDIAIVDLSGTQIEGKYKPTSELEIHLGVYRSSAASAVVHAHSSAAVSFSLISDELPVVHYQQLALGGSIPVVPFSPFGTKALAVNTLKALTHKNAAILAHHGTVTTGSSLESAVYNAILLEWLCQLYLQAAAVRLPRALNDQELKAVMDVVADSEYGGKQANAPLNPNAD